LLYWLDVEEWTKSTMGKMRQELEAASKATIGMKTEVPSAAKMGTKMAVPSARAGRPARHDWDAFWIEVAIFTALNGSDQADRERLQKEMVEWTSTNWPDPPDPATIRGKLKKLFDAASKRA